MMMERLENAPGDFRPLTTVGSTLKKSSTYTDYFDFQITNLGVSLSIIDQKVRFA